MKPLEVAFRHSALADLQDIYLYILERSRIAAVASGFTDRIVARAEFIGNAPWGGIARNDLAEGLRMVPFERTAVILYRIERDRVEIVNVVYGGRDYAALFGDSGPPPTTTD